MPKKVVQYNMLISCPGDVQDEVSIIEKIVEESKKLLTFKRLSGIVYT